MSQNTLDALFPLPSRPPSLLSPTAMPGVDPEAGAMLVQCLKEDYVKFHIYFNDRSFHNHLAHHLFAAYNMGAKASLIKAAYEANASYQRPAYKSPGPIDAKNWKDHLGDEKYYNAYLEFFATEVLSMGISTALETYVFSSDANWGSERDPAKAPRMLDRFYSGLIHPIIHFGHGAEFGIPGMGVQGLAWTAVHDAPAPQLLPPEFFEPETTGSTLSRLTEALSLSSSARSKSKGVDAFTLLGRMLEDPCLAPGVAATESHPTAKSNDDNFTGTLKKEGSLIYSYGSQWDGDIEELSWAAALIYGVGGWNAKWGFRADFFSMHIVTSSLFLPSIAGLLSPASQRLLLRSWFLISLGYWVSRGRPAFPIKEFYKHVSTSPSPPVQSPPMPDPTLDQETVVQNGWFAIIPSVLQHPDEHLLKLVRALAHYSTLYGHRAKGFWTSKGLPGTEELDGTLFVRVAGLSVARLGYVREGEERRPWDRQGFFDN